MGGFSHESEPGWSSKNYKLLCLKSLSEPLLQRRKVHGSAKVTEEKSTDVAGGRRWKKEGQWCILLFFKKSCKIYRKILIFCEKDPIARIKNLGRQLHEKLNHVLKY